MPDRADINSIPGDLPVPKDDGACDHLKSGTTELPSLSLSSTSNTKIDPSTLQGLTILFCYPRTGNTKEVVPEEWNQIPGARGCTPQACSFRDLFQELKQHGVAQVFGVSTQDTPYQQELKERIHLPYDILSDERLEMVKELSLPTFEFDGMTLIRRLTLAVLDGRIVKVWYPVFPSDKSAAEVLEWLKAGKN